MRASLIKFLEGDVCDALSRACLEDLAASADLCPGCVGPASRAELFQIYRVRALINQKKNGGIEGFERLITSLEKKQQGRIRIYDFTGTRHYTIFVDPIAREILGVLRFPREKQA